MHCVRTRRKPESHTSSLTSKDMACQGLGSGLCRKGREFLRLCEGGLGTGYLRCGKNSWRKQMPSERRPVALRDRQFSWEENQLLVSIQIGCPVELQGSRMASKEDV